MEHSTQTGSSDRDPKNLSRPLDRTIRPWYSGIEQDDAWEDRYRQYRDRKKSDTAWQQNPTMVLW